MLPTGPDYLFNFKVNTLTESATFYDTLTCCTNRAHNPVLSFCNTQLCAMQAQLPFGIQARSQLSKASPLCCSHEPHCWLSFWCHNKVRSCHQFTDCPLPCEHEPKEERASHNPSYHVSESLWRSLFFWFWHPLSLFRTVWVLNIRCCFQKNWRLIFFPSWKCQIKVSILMKIHCTLSPALDITFCFVLFCF